MVKVSTLIFCLLLGFFTGYSFGVSPSIYFLNDNIIHKNAVAEYCYNLLKSSHGSAAFSRHVIDCDDTLRKIEEGTYEN